MVFPKGWFGSIDKTDYLAAPEWFRSILFLREPTPPSGSLVPRLGDVEDYLLARLNERYSRKRPLDG